MFMRQENGKNPGGRGSLRLDHATALQPVDKSRNHFKKKKKEVVVSI